MFSALIWKNYQANGLTARVRALGRGQYCETDRRMGIGK
jgi:hypothetical protein